MLSDFFSRGFPEHNGRVTTETSEFSFLPDQAAALGTVAPRATRLRHTLADGRTLSAVRYGEGDPEITLVHGAGLNAHTWDTTAILLGLPALAIDLAGHGDSDWRTDADYSPAHLAADLAAALPVWTTTPQLLVGHSLGGMTSSVLAATHPQLLRALMLVDIAPGIELSGGPAELREFFTVTDFASRDEAVDRAMAFGFGGDRAATARGVFHNTRIRPDGRVEWKHHFAHLAAQTLAAAPAGDDRGDRNLLFWAALEGAAMPVTLVRGTRGYLSDEIVAEFARRLPAATVHTVDAGHNVQENDPATLAGLIRQALIPTA